MQKLSHQTHSFDEFTLDLTRGSLLRGQEEIKLRPKAFDVLSYLIENHGRLVSKDELIKAVWPDSFVTDDSLVQCLMEVRRALGDEGQQIIKTVPRRGYIYDK
jgi:DNA-binding winged helix-turn-helix (wHTH) protein